MVNFLKGPIITRILISDVDISLNVPLKIMGGLKQNCVCHFQKLWINITLKTSIYSAIQLIYISLYQVWS